MKQRVRLQRASRGLAVMALFAGVVWTPPAGAQSNDVNYEYDALGRLIEVERAAAGKTETYSFDALGNRTSVIQGLPAEVTFSVDDVSVSEGGSLVFTIAKSGSTGQSHDVDYATANGTAVSSDYTSKSGTASFDVLETEKTVSVPTTEDATYENPETVLLDLFNATNGAAIADNQGVGTINNDDAGPSFSINNVTKQEGQNLTFTITKTGATAVTHNVDYATANNTALAGSDYVAESGTVSFTSSQTSKTVTIDGIEDETGEPTETFYVNLTNATNDATISDSQGVGTITNDDNFPPVAVDDTYTNVNKRQWTTFYVLDNDSDPDGDSLTITDANTFGGGVVQIINNATALRYICPNCQIIDPVVTYVISDGNGGTDTGVVYITLSGGGGGPPP